MNTLQRAADIALVFLGNLLLFLMAYVPLLLMIAALVFPKSFIGSVVLAIFAIAVAVIGRISIGRSTRRSRPKVLVTNIENDGRASMAYLATYILPILSGMPDSTEKWVAASIYVLTLFIIFSQTDVRAVNPTLFIFGLKVARITIKDLESPIEAICMTNVQVNDRVKLSSFGGAKVVK